MTNLVNAVKMRASVPRKSPSGSGNDRSERTADESGDQGPNYFSKQPYASHRAHSFEVDGSSVGQCDIPKGDLLNRALWIHDSGM